ncbi:arsenate reductase ArsC [Polynucleobacter antarcticus]|uniref:Protein-tyrosine-phosphatase n=1 Tax=Polynucleobacter antarcticus TaxID=1743162 RepID=A0A6M9PPC9_9BURK|nr:arsenate reductase ArsC [Polynucleobacter antarcticus]QKM62379.1 protein-tyrosine-phosphatase [Polynucleobacter antarcticus]
MNEPFNILFLCAGNSSRSILAEALTTTLSHGRFIAFSAGAKPTGTVHPLAIELIKPTGYPIQLLRSKSWDEFGRESAPAMNFVITLCESALGEHCPYWRGHPATAHWGFPDPAADDSKTRDEMLHSFKQVEKGLHDRIALLMDLPLEKLDRSTIRERLQNIHHRLKYS